jgi:hypothetical protein
MFRHLRATISDFNLLCVIKNYFMKKKNCNNAIFLQTDAYKKY